MSIQQLQIEKNQMELLNLFPSAAAVLNDSGEILITNREWEEKKYSGFFINCSINENFFEHCRCAVEKGSDDALKLVINLRKILDRESDTIQTTCTIKEKDDTKWYRVSIRPFEQKEAILFIEDISENVTAIRELRDSQEKYYQQFNHSINGIIIGTPSGKILDANPAACKLLGYTVDELISGGRELILDENNLLNAEAERIREEKSYFEGEKQYKHKLGYTVSVMMSSVIFRDKDMGLTTINSFHDISREKRIQTKLKNEQEFTRTAIDSIPGTFFVLDSEGTFLQWNEAFKEKLGYTQKDIIELKPTDLFLEEDQEMIASKLEETLRVGFAETIGRVKTKNGAYRSYILNTRSFKNEKAKYIVGTGMDITEQLEAKKTSEKHYRMMCQLFENSPLGIVMIDEENKIEMVNNGFRKMFGYKNGDVVGSNVNNLITKNDTRGEADKLSSKAFKGIASQLESIRYTNEGKKVPVLLSSVPVSDGEKVIAVYGIYVDLTAQKDLEKQITSLLNSEKEAHEKAQNSLKQNEILLQEVHHRVKNNLAIIAGLLDLQLLEEKDKGVFRKLSEVQSRIFSIAKIHETLYQEKNVVHIRFNSYLKSFVKFLPQQGYNTEIISELNLNCDETILNLNQAVPAGLMINELINVLLPDNGKASLMLNLKSDNTEVIISLSGNGLEMKKLQENIESEHFQYKLVDILLAQLNGQINIDVKKKKITISFLKTESKGSSNAFFK